MGHLANGTLRNPRAPEYRFAMCLYKCEAWCKSVGLLQGLVPPDEHQALQWAEEGSGLQPEDAWVEVEAELQLSRIVSVWV